MRKALALLFVILICSPPAHAREGRIVGLRYEPATRVPASQSLATVQDRVAMAEQDRPSVGGQTRLMGPVLNCGNDGVIAAAGTLVLEAGDAAGTAYPPVAAADSIDITNVVFGVLDLGGSYPATMAVDFWHRTSGSGWDFVVGVNIAVDTNPGIAGEIYNVDLSGLGLRTNPEMMVLLSDLDPPNDGLMLPAGDEEQSCFDGVNFCSVLLPAASADLFLYGITDADACPSAVDNIQLFDVVVEVEVEPFIVANEEESFGTVKARFGN